jgi:hypothetical protein
MKTARSEGFPTDRTVAGLSCCRQSLLTVAKYYCICFLILFQPAVSAEEFRGVQPRHIGWFPFRQELLAVNFYGTFDDNVVRISLNVRDSTAKSRDEVVQTAMTLKVWVLTDDGGTLRGLHQDHVVVPLFFSTGSDATMLFSFEHKPEKAAIAAVVIRMRGQMGLIPMRELERLNLDRDEQDILDQLNTLPFLEEIGDKAVPPAEVQGLKRNTLITRNNLLRQLREQEREVIFDPALGRFVIE